MENNRHGQSNPQARETMPLQRPSRRTFLTAAVGAFGAAAFWTLRRSPLPAVEASGSGGNSGSVTIVQFSDLGKPTGKATVPRVTKSDHCCPKQLITFPA